MSPEHHEHDRSGAGSGVLFVILFVVGIIPLGGLLGSFGDSDATFDIYFANSSNRAANMVGGGFLAASGFAFLWFLQHLRQSLQSDDNRSATLPNFMFNTGLVFIALHLVGSAALISVSVTRAFGGLFDEKNALDVGQAVLPQFGYVVLAFYSLLAATVMVASATLSARRAGVFPRWLCRFGFTVTVLIPLFSMSGGMAFFMLPIWVLAVSIYWFRIPNQALA